MKRPGLLFPLNQCSLSTCTIDRWSCYSIQHCYEKNVPTGVIFDQIFRFKTLLEASSLEGYFSFEHQTWNDGMTDVHRPPTLTLRSRTGAAKPTLWPTLNPCHFTVPCFIYKTKTVSFSSKQALSNNVFGVKIGRTTTLGRLFKVINFRRSKFVCTLWPGPVFGMCAAGLATHLTTPVCPVARTQTIILQVVYWHWYCTVHALCRCLSRHWSLTFCTLNSFKLCTHQWMCTSSYTQAFPFFLLLSWVGSLRCLYWFRVYSDVGVVGVQLTKYSLEVMREYGRHGEPCIWSQDSVEHACTARQRLSLASALLLPDRTRETVLLEFPSSRKRFPSTVLVMAKDWFSKIPLSRWTTHLPVTCWYTSDLFEGAPNKFREISP